MYSFLGRILSSSVASLFLRLWIYSLPFYEPSWDHVRLGMHPAAKKRLNPHTPSCPPAEPPHYACAGQESGCGGPRPQFGKWSGGRGTATKGGAEKGGDPSARLGNPLTTLQAHYAFKAPPALPKRPRPEAAATGRRESREASWGTARSHESHWSL